MTNTAKLEKLGFKTKIKKIGFFKFKSDFFLFILDLLFKLIIFSKEIIKFYYKIINVLFFFTKLTKFYQKNHLI